MATFYATFGINQPNAGFIVEVNAETREEANELMFKRYGSRWAFLYNSLSSVHADDMRKGILEVIGVVSDVHKTDYGNQGPNEWSNTRP